MRIFFENGIHLQEGIREVVLDPRKPCPGSVVSHAHLDHLTSGGVMTPATRDIMRARLGRGEGHCVPYGETTSVSGHEVRLLNAGHVLGSAMIQVGDVLYSGDVNPEGGLTCGSAEPTPCETLILEATYGRSMFRFPPKAEVMEDLLGWVEAATMEGPVAVGAYEFGKAQEIMALVQRARMQVVVTDKIAEISEVFTRHGNPLTFRRFSDLSPEERKGAYVFVVPRRMLKAPGSPEVRELKQAGGKTCFVSGWCTIYNLKPSLDLDAQFPISDHADYEGLIEFAGACSPKRVYTCHGYNEDLAKGIRDRHGIEAIPLGSH